MSADDLQSVLRRLVARAVAAPDPTKMSPNKALKIAIPKAADHAMDLPLVVSGISVEKQSRDALLAALEECQLYMLIRTADERLGIAIPDAALLSGLIEIQTMGEVSAHLPIKRQPTRTDASMVEPFIDSVLGEFVQQLTDLEELPHYQGFSYFRLVEDQRHLPLILAECDYTSFDISMELGQVFKPAKLLLSFPKLMLEENVANELEQSKKWSADLEAGVMGASVDIDVTLHRFSMPLDEVSKLAVGFEVPIPREAIHTLQVEGSDGLVVAEGKLGQVNGHRAIKFSTTSGVSNSDAQNAALSPLPTKNPLEVLGPVDGPIPVTSTDAVFPMDTGLPADFADISPPDEGQDELDQIGGIPGLIDIPNSGDTLGLADLPSQEGFPAMEGLSMMEELPDLEMTAKSLKVE